MAWMSTDFLYKLMSNSKKKIFVPLNMFVRIYSKSNFKYSKKASNIK